MLNEKKKEKRKRKKKDLVIVFLCIFEFVFLVISPNFENKKKNFRVNVYMVYGIWYTVSEHRFSKWR